MMIRYCLAACHLPVPPTSPPDACLLPTLILQAQVENMTNKWHVYMTMDGRISMAGLSGALRCADVLCMLCCAVLCAVQRRLLHIQL